MKARPFRPLAYARRVKADEAARTEPAPARRLAWSTAIFAAATGLSRVFGLVREIVARNYFGVQGSINAFEIAFLIPNTVRALVADAALSGAFVPVFGELLEKGNRARAWRVASTLFWLMLIGLGTLTALFVLLAPWLMSPFPYKQDLLVGLSRILFPLVLLLGLSGIVVGILNSYEHFTVPALAPVFWNAVIILGLVIGVPLVESEDAKLLRRVFVLMLPVTLALGLINVNALINAVFAAKLIDPDIAPSAINAAFRIYMLPQGIFSVAVATVLFPRLARLAARADLDGFRETVSLGLRQIGFLLLPASAVSAVLAVPIVRLAYERGAFTAGQTTVVAGALAAFSLGLTFNGTMLMLNRAFFSLQSPWTPTAIALGNLGLNATLATAFYRVGVWGLPLATSLVNIAGTGALLFVFRRRMGRVDGGRLVDSYLRIAVASALAAGAAFAVWYGLDAAVGRSVAGQLLSVGGALGVSVGLYVALARAFSIRELEVLLSLRRRSATTS